MFKQYIRYSTGEPFGVVVIDNSKIGWSLCSPLDKFNKKIGERIAVNRANSDCDFYEKLKSGLIPSDRCGEKYKVLIRRGDTYQRYCSKKSALFDKIEYLKTKLNI